MKFPNDGLERRNRKTESVWRDDSPPTATYLGWNRLERLQSVLIAVATERQLTDGCLQVLDTGPSAESTHTKLLTATCRHRHGLQKNGRERVEDKLVLIWEGMLSVAVLVAHSLMNSSNLAQSQSSPASSTYGGTEEISVDLCTWAQKLHMHLTEDAGVRDPAAQIIRHKSKKCLCARLMLEIFLMLPKDDIFKAVRQIN